MPKTILLAASRDERDLGLLRESLAGTGYVVLPLDQAQDPDFIAAFPEHMEAKELKAIAAAHPNAPMIIVAKDSWRAPKGLAACQRLSPDLPRSVLRSRLRNWARTQVARRFEPCGTKPDSDMLAGLLEYLHAALVLVDDGTGKVLHCNRPAQALLGLTREESLSMTADAIYARMAGLHAPADRRPCPGQAIVHEDLAFTRPDGGVMHLLHSVVPTEHHGRPARMLVFFDITARVLWERQSCIDLRMEAIGRLSAGIAHEINTPVQYIGDNIRFLQDACHKISAALSALHAAGPRLAKSAKDSPWLADLLAALDQAELEYHLSEIPKALSQTAEGVRRVADIVRGMKKFAHPDDGEFRHADLNQALRDTALVARNEWKYVADVRFDLDPCLPMVPCLPGDMNQVFLNLLVNAAHAVEARKRPQGQKGTITLLSRRRGDMVEIRFSDDGVGIAPEHRHRIFEPFFTTKEPGRGTGQGLTMAKVMVTERHGGSLEFESSPGMGATFILKLPLRRRETP